MARPAHNAPAATVGDMRASSIAITVLVTVTAPLAGAVAYQTWAPGPAGAAPSAAGLEPTTVDATRVIKFRPCAKPARLEHGVCVTRRVRVVVAPAGPATPATNDTSTEPAEDAGDGWSDPGAVSSADPTAGEPDVETTEDADEPCDSDDESEESDDDHAGDADDCQAGTETASDDDTHGNDEGSDHEDDGGPDD